MASLPDIPTEFLHPASLADAAEVQRALASRVVRQGSERPILRVAGCDVSQFFRDPSGRIFAAVVVLDARTLEPIETATAEVPAPLPYVPGFLGFRETPALVAAFRRLATLPDLVLVDGHGVSHPRGLGIASHLGVLIDLPTIGVAKSVLIGHPASPCGPDPGDRTALLHKGVEVATAIRTRRRATPVYASIGHRIDLAAAADWTSRLCRRHRLPEPTRLAHLAANDARRAAGPVPRDEASRAAPPPAGTAKV